MPELSVIIPVFNEETVIADTISRIADAVDPLGIGYEILVVNDGSTDRTLERLAAIRNERLRIVSYATNRGKGFAIHHGMKHAEGVHSLFMDADLSTSLEAVGAFLDKMRSGTWDMIIGNRRIKGAHQNIPQPFYRRFFGKGFTLLSQIMVGYPGKDFTCGFKMFRMATARVLFEKQRVFNWAFDAELIFLAGKYGLSILEVPVRWDHRGNSKVNLGRDMANSFLGLLAIRANDIKGRYDRADQYK